MVKKQGADSPFLPPFIQNFVTHIYQTPTSRTLLTYKATTYKEQQRNKKTNVPVTPLILMCANEKQPQRSRHDRECYLLSPPPFSVAKYFMFPSRLICQLCIYRSGYVWTSARQQCLVCPSVPLSSICFKSKEHRRTSYRARTPLWTVHYSKLCRLVLSETFTFIYFTCLQYVNDCLIVSNTFWMYKVFTLKLPVTMLHYRLFIPQIKQWSLKCALLSGCS